MHVFAFTSNVRKSPELDFFFKSLGGLGGIRVAQYFSCVGVISVIKQCALAMRVKCGPDFSAEAGNVFAARVGSFYLLLKQKGSICELD